MRTVLYSLSLFIVMGTFFGCKKVDELTKFDMDYNTTVVIPASSGINLPFNVFSPSVTSNSESTFEVNDTRKDLIEEIILKKLELTVKTPNGEDFSFLESISIYINAQDLPEVKIAWNDAVPDGAGTVLGLTTSNVDLKEYIKKDNFTLRVNTVADEVLASDYHINVFSQFFVDAKILGQ